MKKKAGGGGKGEGAPRGPLRWRAVAVAPGLEGEGFLGLEELVCEGKADPEAEVIKGAKKAKRRLHAETSAEAGGEPERIRKKKRNLHAQQQHQQQQEGGAAHAACIALKRKSQKRAAAGATAAATAEGDSALQPFEGGMEGLTAAAAAAAAPTAAAAAAAAFECMYDSYELAAELEGGLPHWKAILNDDLHLLHPAVSRVLLQQRLLRPTPVQQQVLLHAVRDRKDVVVAAQTGSGKTLAFALPIASSLASQLARRLEKWQERRAKQQEQKQQQQQQLMDCAAEEGTEETQKQTFLLQQLQPRGPAALVLEPTRELALQVLHVLQQLCAYAPIRAAAVVGGLSQEKQLRVLGSSRPLVLVATPGRLLALQRQRQQQQLQHSAAAAADEQEAQQQHVLLPYQGRKERLAAEGLAFAKNFSLLQFLVLDEADRLLQPQQQQQQRRKKQQRHRRALPPPTETEALLQLVYGQLDAAPPKGSISSSSNNSSSEKKLQLKQQNLPRHIRGRAASLQTFVLSATLALALQRKQQGLKLLSSSSSGEEEGSGAAAALLQHVRIRAKALVAVRISDEQQQQHVWQQHQQEQQQQQQQQKEGVGLQQHGGKLPVTLRLSVWKCPVKSDLEVHLVAYLLRTFDAEARDHKPLKMVLFVNAISYVYRLESLLGLLLREQLQQRHRQQIEVFGLHSNLQQKQRLKRLDRFTRSKYGLLVSTDVAARGVDFVNVQKSLQLQMPRDAETFIHRCGRTARAGRAGEAVCFVSSSVAYQWESLFAAAGVELGSSPPPVGFEDVAAFQENPATMKRIFQVANELERNEHKAARRQRRMGTLQALAAAADIEVDSELSGGDGGGEEAASCSKRRGKQLRQNLRQVGTGAGEERKKSLF
ncbi:hypothetical protein Esti_002656 [Eimeria stiedai]